MSDLLYRHLHVRASPAALLGVRVAALNAQRVIAGLLEGRRGLRLAAVGGVHRWSRTGERDLARSTEVGPGDPAAATTEGCAATAAGGGRTGASGRRALLS